MYNADIPMAVTLTLCEPETVNGGNLISTLELKVGCFFKSISTGVLVSFGVPSG